MLLAGCRLDLSVSAGLRVSIQRLSALPVVLVNNVHELTTHSTHLLFKLCIYPLHHSCSLFLELC
jgi:hypothetical protein